MTNPISELVSRLRAIMFTASDESALQDHNTTREAADALESQQSTIQSLEAENAKLDEECE